MNRQDEYPRVNRRIKNAIHRGSNKSFAASSTWIIRKYLYYALRALVNGYPINVKKTAWIKLVHEEPKDYGRNDEYRYFQSSKLYGYMFSIIFELKLHNHENIFYPDIELRKLLLESMESDVIYELVKP